ncbi:MAG: oligoendopeptidase F [Lachnospiraceae bacterium]|nr:oligoendopeptidase F [Robinsoniella sp.]MDY3766193.1 oligoendopeptidase F [Lachnospiraceae bacterium]
MGQKKLPKREEVRKEDCWAIEDLYENDELWKKDAEKVKQEIEKIAKFKGKLAQNKETLLCFLDSYAAMMERFEKVNVYANQRFHENTKNSTYQKLSGEAQVLQNQMSSATAFAEPEILAMEDQVLEQWMEESERLRFYKRFLGEILRGKPHTLSIEQEEMLARAGEMGQAPYQIYAMFNNADITFGSVKDENGEEVVLSAGRFIAMEEKSDRTVRREAFETFYRSYENFKNTLAAIFDANLRQTAFFAKEHRYTSAREYYLDGNAIPVSVYDQLIETIHKNMNLMYRYVALRKKILGLDELHMYDVYVPLAADVSREYTFEEAKQIVQEGLKPLGEKYGAILKEGMESGWIDIYENEGKRTGAYSWGAYGTHPYVLLNFDGTLNNVFTLAHEMGHSLHSYFSDAAQPYLYAGYKIFVAEVASTCNEALLIHHLMEQSKDENERLYLVNYFLDKFKGTMFRQTMFAEFEKITHEAVEAGEVMTADRLCEIYYDLNKQYFGDEMVSDSEIAIEWARIPHFYTPFYVYQYATGFSAAIAISQKILNGEPKAVENYMKFLSSGGSMDPIDLLKICDVDMTTPKPIEEALGVFEKYLDELEKLSMK